MSDPIAIKNTILCAIAAFGSLLGPALGGMDAILALLIGMMAADYITGLLVAAVWNKSSKSASGALDSKASFKGLSKKGVILLIILIGVLLDKALGTNYVRNAFILFFCGNEGLSLLENLGLMGVPYPPMMHRMLEALKSESESMSSKN